MSFDAYLWQIVESKAKAIAQVMNGKNPSREIEDVDETVLNYAEVKAIATGNPLIKRKMELELEVQRLQILESQYRHNRYSLEDDISKRIPAKLAKLSGEIQGFDADIGLRNEHITLGEDGKPVFHMRLGKREFTERKEAGEMLLKAVKSRQYADKVIGHYRGFDIVPREQKSFIDEPVILLKGALTHDVTLSESDVGSIARIENTLERLEAYRDDDRREAADLERRLEASKLRLGQPFEQERELASVLSELAKVNAELDLDRGADDGALLDDGEQQENDNDDVPDPDDEVEDENGPEL